MVVGGIIIYLLKKKVPYRNIQRELKDHGHDISIAIIIDGTSGAY